MLRRAAQPVRPLARQQEGFIQHSHPAQITPNHGSLPACRVCWHPHLHQQYQRRVVLHEHHPHGLHHSREDVQPQRRPLGHLRKVRQEGGWGECGVLCSPAAPEIHEGSSCWGLALKGMNGRWAEQRRRVPFCLFISARGGLWRLLQAADTRPALPPPASPSSARWSSTSWTPGTSCRAATGAIGSATGPPAGPTSSRW
jgi:hypothetical protein